MFNLPLNEHTRRWAGEWTGWVLQLVTTDDTGCGITLATFQAFSSNLCVPCTLHTRCSLCEHEGCFNMLRPLLTHMCARQGGKGVVAVSPRYAQR